MSSFYTEKSVSIHPDPDYFFEVTVGDMLQVEYKEGPVSRSISFSSKEEMRAVATAMLELSKED